jgi:hypothetical protein
MGPESYGSSVKKMTGLPKDKASVNPVFCTQERIHSMELDLCEGIPKSYNVYDDA